MSTLISGLQNRVKNSAAYAQELGLMLICNGEEKPYLLSSQGEKIEAGIPAPIVAPTVADNGSGNLPNGNYIVYSVTYASENTFPLVGAVIQSLGSPNSATYHITGSGTRQTLVTVTGTVDPLVTHVYLFRTNPAATVDLAVTAAAAGLLNYVGKVANPGATTATIVDNNATVIGNIPIDLTAIPAPQFRFVVWDGSFFWGFGNQPFTASATWSMDGTFTLNNPSVDKFYGGRDGQYITFDGITTGGVDNRGTFLFKQTGDFTGKVQLLNGSDTTLPSTATGTIIIVGPSADLYRSAYRNPFQWGYMQNVGGIYVPALWDLKVSGSIGTAIAIIPDQQLLKLDMEFPALCVTYALQSASTDVFRTTQRQVSRLYSVTSHFSQFFAMAGGRQVLWGMDYKNLALVQCDGYTQVPISKEISLILRNLTKNRSLQLQCHGVYDPTTEINAIWLSSSLVDASISPTNFDICVYQHAPTGYWGIILDYGILSSAVLEDTNSSTRSVLVGGENGFLGKAFDPKTYGNWLPINSIQSGYISHATANTITRAEGQDDFSPLDAGLIGNYCLLVDAGGISRQIVKIVGATNNTLTFQQTLNPIPTTSSDAGLTDPQWQFFTGLNELRMLKYFDDGEPSKDKAPVEFWATLVDANFPRIEYYPEHDSSPSVSIPLNQNTTLDSWFQKMKFPTTKEKTFGLSIVERSYNATLMYNFSLASTNPATTHGR